MAAQRRLLVHLFRLPFVAESSFLTGGTCLSVFYLGHRKSDDLDLFSLHEIDFSQHWTLLRTASGGRGIGKGTGRWEYMEQVADIGFGHMVRGANRTIISLGTYPPACAAKQRGASRQEAV